MSAIYLVRHGQASFGKSNYDELSALGIEQSRMLGEYFSPIIDPHFVISGSMRRHQQTASAYLESSTKQKELLIEEGFNEFNHIDVIEKYDARWQDRQAFTEFLRQQKSPRGAFQEIFNAAVMRWIDGEYANEYDESWDVFYKRVTESLKNLATKVGRGTNTIVFTSGGPIAVVCQFLLGMDKKIAFSINENLVNSGVTRIVFNDSKMSLSYLNNYSHLETTGANYITYR